MASTCQTRHNTNCCVNDCHSRKGSDRSVHFHYFPQKTSGIHVKILNEIGQEEEIDKRIAWERVLMMEKPITDNMRVCSKHFTQEDYCAGGVKLKQPKLKKFAVPSQNLPKQIFHLDLKSDGEPLVKRQKIEEESVSTVPLFEVEDESHSENKLVNDKISIYEQLLEDDKEAGQNLEIVKIETPALIPDTDPLQIIKIEEVDDVKVKVKQEEIDIFDCRSEVKQEDIEISESNGAYEQTDSLLASEGKVLPEAPPSVSSSMTLETIKKETKDIDNTKYNMSNKVTKYKCDRCTYQTRQKGRLKRHIKTQLNCDRTHYKCVTCDYQTKYKRSLDRHQKTHLNLEEVEHYTCEICGYRTKFKDYLQRHQTKHLSYDEVEHYQCVTCDYRSKYKKNIKTHQLLHSNHDEVLQYKCQVCNYQTQFKSNFRRHEKSHLPQLPLHMNPDEVMYKCGLCQYQSNRMGTLKRHQKIHFSFDEVTHYNCETCSFRTKHKQSFNNHQKQHSK